MIRSGKLFKTTSFFIISVLVMLLLGPFLIPVSPLENTLPVEQMVDDDSQFIEVNGINVHYKRIGQGDPAIILLHGFGASTFSWREVVQPLSELGSVIVYDRPAFGLTERPMVGEWQVRSPYGAAAQVQMLLGLMDVLGVQKAILIGNSAGGTIATLAALEHPDRIQGLVEVDAAIYNEGGFHSWLVSLMRTPQLRRIGPLLVRAIADSGNDTIRTAWHDPKRVTQEILDGYRKPLQIENWDRALWEFSASRADLNLSDRLKELAIPVLVLTGDDDRIVATENSLRLAQDIPGAQLVVFEACGHVPQEECPAQFLAAVVQFLYTLK